MNQNTFKSIGAVIAGMIMIVILSIGTDFVLGSLSEMLVLALLYRSIYSVAGGYVTALLAPNRPMQHAIILGSIGVVLSSFGAIAAWNLSAHWYPIALIITALPCTWFGGKLKSK